MAEIKMKNFIIEIGNKKYRMIGSRLEDICEELGISEDRFIEILSRDAYCPTLSAAPTSSTLTYVDTDGSTNHFRVGQLCRWAEGSDYRLAVCKNATQTSVAWHILPTKVSELTNDAGYLTQHQDISHLATTSALSSGLSGKVDKVDGKQLSTEDFTTVLKNKLNGLSNYDDTTITAAVNKLRTDFDTLVSGDTTTAIKSFNDIVAFLDGLTDSEDLDSIIASIEQQIAGKQDEIADLATIRNGAALGATALQSYTEKYTGTVTGVKINGTTKTPNSGVVDLGTVITSHQDISGKVDKVDGKGLSTNDYTTTEKEKLAGIASGAEVNVQSDWNATSGDAFIKNKPTLAAVATSGSYNDLSNKPTIPSAITVDSSLSSTSTNPVQNKVINSALSGKLSTSGTAAAATKLANKRTIWGQEFDGTGNITGDITTSGNVKITNLKGIAGAKSDGTYIMAFQPRNASNQTILTYGTGGFSLQNESSSSAFVVNSSRNVGIRTSASSSYNVYIAGSVYTDNQLTVEGTLTAKSALVAKSTFGVANTSQFEKDVTMFAGLKFYSGGVIYGYGSDGTYQSCFWPRAGDITYLNYGTKGFRLRNNSSTEIMAIDSSDATTFKKNVTVSGTFTNPSSLVLKNVLNRDCLTLEQLSRIKPARFTWKDERDRVVHIGGIADEVKAVIPEVVHEQEDGTFTMEYANAAFAMSASLVKYVKQNQERIEYLESEIVRLKQMMAC